MRAKCSKIKNVAGTHTTASRVTHEFCAYRDELMRFLLVGGRDRIMKGVGHKPIRWISGQ